MNNQKYILYYIEKINEEKNEIKRIVNIDENSKNIRFKFKDKYLDEIFVHYNALKNEIKIMKNGRIYYNVLQKVGELSKFNIYFSMNEIDSNMSNEIFTKKIKYKNENNKIQIEVEYILQNDEVYTKYVLERIEGR